MDLTLKNKTVTSLELLEMINGYRKEYTTKKDLAHKDLLKVIRDEFDEEISQGKLSPSDYTNERGKKYPMFNLTPSQGKQVLVRESKQVRKAVIKKLEEIEKELETNGYIISDNINNEQIKEVKKVVSIKKLINGFINGDITIKVFKSKVDPYLKKLKWEKRDKEIKALFRKLDKEEMTDISISHQINVYKIELLEWQRNSNNMSNGRKIKNKDKEIKNLSDKVEKLEKDLENTSEKAKKYDEIKKI